MAERLVRPIGTPMRELVHSMLEKAIERGEIRSDIDLEAITRVVHALTLAVGDSQALPYLNTYFQITDDVVSPEQALDVLLTLILRGIGVDR